MTAYKCIVEVRTSNGNLIFKKGKKYYAIHQNMRFMFFGTESPNHDKPFVSLTNEHMDVYFTTMFKYGK